MIIALLFYFVVLLGFLYFTGLIANHVFGDINVILKDIMANANENSNILQLITSLPDEKQFVLYGWQICFIIASFVLGFLYMMYCPFLIDIEANVFAKPFVAFWRSLKFTFKNILSVAGLYLIIYIANMILSILRSLAQHNMILSVLLLFVYIYFLAVVVMIIFNYYESKNNSTDRSNSIGENKAIDSVGTQD